LKLSKKYKYIIYKLSDDYKEIVVEEASADKDWETFREKLINATSKNKAVRLPTSTFWARSPKGGLDHLLGAASRKDGHR
jgi:hypothetical protein